MSTRALSCCIPSRDGQAEIATIYTLAVALPDALGRRVLLHVGQAGNIPRARNKAQREAEAAQPDADPVWCLWIDTDIVLGVDQADAVARYIARAEAENVGWVAHYRQADGRSVFAADRARHTRMLADEEARALPDWAPVAMAGPGLAYLPMPRGYVWHADDMGEDMHLWLDTGLEVRFARDIDVRHHRAVYL